MAHAVQHAGSPCRLKPTNGIMDDLPIDFLCIPSRAIPCAARVRVASRNRADVHERFFPGCLLEHRSADDRS